MLIQLDPHDLLVDVHIDLVHVAQAASQSPQPFRIVYGLRTLEAEAKAVAEGHSETMHSRHLADARYGGKAMAFDFGCFDAAGAYIGAGPSVPALYGAAAAQILAAAAKLGVKAQWGGQPVGAWVDGVASHFRDWGHIQLDPSAYPA